MKNPQWSRKIENGGKSLVSLVAWPIIRTLIIWSWYLSYTLPSREWVTVHNHCFHSWGLGVDRQAKKRTPCVLVSLPAAIKFVNRKRTRWNVRPVKNKILLDQNKAPHPTSYCPLACKNYLLVCSDEELALETSAIQKNIPYQYITSCGFRE